MDMTKLLKLMKILADRKIAFVGTESQHNPPLYLIGRTVPPVPTHFPGLLNEQVECGTGIFGHWGFLVFHILGKSITL